MKKNLIQESRMGCRLFAYFAAIILMAGCASASGCGIEKTDGSKISDMAYEMVEEEDLPEELKAKIEEKKSADFKLTYEADGYLYVVRGYGEQETGGYSIAVNGCYLTKNAIYFDTTLIGPSKGEKINEVKSYPYIVVRTKYIEKNVVFE